MNKVVCLLVTLMIAVMSWENQLNAATPFDQGPIPEESIRLRIIANSDSFQDQWLKREVRDAIIDQMNTWVAEIDNYDQAAALVEAKLPELQQVVEQTMRERGFAYQATVDFGQVEFPTKLYGNYVYPAGEYQALRVRIGEAKGQNWWCVLFPPLCFIDMSNGDAVATAQPATQSAAAPATAPVQEDKQAEATEPGLFGKLMSFFNGDEAEENVNNPVDKNNPPKETVEVRFYLWDKLVALFA